MSARTGLGGPETGYGLTTAVLEALDLTLGMGPRYTYPLLVDLTASWRLHLPLLDGSGNFGSQHGDPPADARYTEVRLSGIGELALAAERGEVGPVPLGLIEGSFYRGGRVPPFAPARVLEALTAGAPDAGSPIMPTGGTVDGNVDRLLAGRPTRLTLGSTIAREPGALVITEVPFDVTVDDVAVQLEHRARAAGHRQQADYLPAGMEALQPLTGPAPVRQVRDESSGLTGIRVVCDLARDADVAQAEAWVRSVWPVTIEVDSQLPAPMGQLLATWDRGDGSGLGRLGALL
ncbi:DNA gyrase subunit A [Oryzihumus leptocrescens]|uniref:DNA gyrase/topoisomerase IV subunit A-like protein n=1 Tax=Oryzihumus leptocrescens TaxID=297536 RepID=A0A542ZH94_9MICO|nr:DNA gyrase subunit A [Oryzihumus leptocrescens]TQL59676.1 DNA gyrase/topoisomerase IV subunit A-like protein [Oryzihumus leptocrescens]